MKTSRLTSHTATVLYLLKEIANWGTQSITTGCFELPVINLISLYTLLKYISDTKNFIRYFTTKFISSLAKDFEFLNNVINSRKRSVLFSQIFDFTCKQIALLHFKGGGRGLSFKNFSGKQNYHLK